MEVIIEETKLSLNNVICDISRWSQMPRSSQHTTEIHDVATECQAISRHLQSHERATWHGTMGRVDVVVVGEVKGWG